MKRFVNVRLPVILALSLIAGILLGYLFIRIDISLFYIIAFVPAAAIIFIFCCIYSRKKLLVFCIFAAVLFAAGIAGSYLKLNSFNTKEIVSGDTYTISATVCEKGKYDSGEYIVVKNAVADGQKIDGKIKVYLSAAYGEYCAVGYSVEFTTSIYTYDTFPYGNLSYNAINDIKYRCNVYGGLSSSYRFSLFGCVNNAIYKTLYENADYDTASVAYAMLTGNTDGIEDGSLSAFRYGGIAHIFAVSGLHMGIIYGLLRLLCKRLHLNKYAALAVCILPLFFYAGVCGFTLSAVRALIMCTVAALARIIYAKYDALNSLSLAVIIILLCNPLSLFNVGFQLSVCAVISVILLSKNFVKRFKRVPAKIKDGASVSLAAQAGTMPVMITRFGYLSGAGILLNILIVPLLSVFFIIIFAATLAALIFPFIAQYILPYAVMPLQSTVSVLTNAGFEKAILRGFGAGAFVPVYYFGLFALSDKFNLKLRYRIISVFCAAAFLCAYVPLKTYAPFSGHKVIVSAYYGGGEVLIKSHDKNILIVTENLYPTQTDVLLNRYYCTHVDALIILGGENCVLVCDKYDFDGDAYVYGNYMNIQPYKNKNVVYENSFTLDGIYCEFTDGYSLLAECDGAKLRVCSEYAEIISDTDTIISFNERNSDNCVYNDGDFVFNF